MTRDERIAGTLTPTEFMGLVAVDQATGCWLWAGPRDDDGYGLVRRAGTQSRAHRVAIVLFHGTPIPAGMRGLHSCDNPPCCNPSHVYVGTQKQNMRDMVDRGRNVTRPPHGEKSPHAKTTRKSVALMRRLRAAGWTYVALAKRFRLSVVQVRLIVRGERWAHVGKGPAQGERSAGAKLTDDTVRAIREEASKGTFQRVLAARFGVTQQIVSDVIARKRWGHVA